LPLRSAPAASALPISSFELGALRAPQARRSRPRLSALSMERLGRALSSSGLSRRSAVLGRLFDKLQLRSSGEASGGAAQPESEGASSSQEAAALHEAWERSAREAEEEFQGRVAAFREGRFGLRMGTAQRGQRLMLVGSYTLDGEPFDPQALAGEPARQWEAAKPKLERAMESFAKEYKELLENREAEHRAVHRRMAALERKAAERRARALLRAGSDLQAWGLPNLISINQKTRLRYTRLYRLNGAPTDLGLALHEVLLPLVEADPGFLGGVSQGQLHRAVQAVYDSLKYRRDDQSLDLQKLIRLGLPFDEGYDHPRERQALLGDARKILTNPEQIPSASAGLGEVPPELRPAAVMMETLQSTYKTLSEKMEAGASQEELEPLGELLRALHAATGVPIDEGYVPLRHAYLRPILAELRRRNAPEEVVSAVIRSFPLGESLLRLGVHKAWERGFTGKGVKIAVVDNGVDFRHPDLSDVPNASKVNLTRDDGDEENGGHATPMASILHAIAPEAELQSYQVLSNSSLPGVALSAAETDQALERALDLAAENGANIVSMSLGAAMGYSNDRLAKKIEELASRGIVVVVAAGNEGDRMPPDFQLSTPGTAPLAITVGAVDYHGRKADFSSEGRVWNPDAGSFARKPDLASFGGNIKAAMQLPLAGYQSEPVPFEYGSGTSPATPHVAAVIALMLQAAASAGCASAGAETTAEALEALLAACRLEPLADGEAMPVLDDAVKAVEAFVARLR
ncbi:MAG: S8 family serine peptidase, partial [Elusimicrobia bacterium]|nr:S8 family serine peptidase [Elusimicrobiota bacterium]